MRLKILCLLSAGCFFFLHAQEKSGGIVFHENEPWTDILNLAKKENKLIFMDCYTVWCGPCKGLAKDVFPKKEVGDFFNANFINTSYDMEKGDGKMLQKKYQQHIIGYPTLLLINSEGEVIHRMAGYKQPDELIAGMREALEGNTFYTVEKKYNEGARDFATISAYTKALKLAYLTEKLNEVTENYLQSLSNQELLKPEVWEIVGKNIKDPFTEKYRFVTENIDKIQHRAKADRYELEQQLGRGMNSAVNNVLKFSASASPDTLRLAGENTNYLLGILTKSNIKNFPDYIAKLRINSMELQNQPKEIFETLRYSRPLGTLSGDKSFLADTYRYIIDNVKDKKMIQTSLDSLLSIQAPYDKMNSPLIGNYYNHIAAGYAKLGKKEEAAKAQAEFDKRDAARKDYFKDIVDKLIVDKESGDLVNKKESAINYSLKGSWENGDGKIIALQKEVEEKIYTTIDSTIVKNGIFELKGSVPETGIYRLTADGRSKELLLCGEPVTLSVTTKINPKNGKTVVTVESEGSPEQAALEKSAELEMGKAFIELGLMLAMSEAKDNPKKLDSLLLVKNGLEAAADQNIRKFIDENVDRYAIAYFIGNFLAKNYPIEFVDSCYAKLSKRVQESAPGIELADKITVLHSVNAGGVAPDISLPSPDGKELKLSSLRGKYVLLDFWASWCGPCLREAPNVREVYAKYHDKGFEVFGVSLDNEKQRDAWLAAIKKHELNWYHVSSLKGWECPAAKLYNVTGIPKTFLIDKQGKIIASDLRGDALKAKLAELFK
ncbi:MAG: redoxin domain-containing protein [Dysgonamonadaceae bacterium]|nr:redoxin domain-containing protein [Dysgonamonadaceae bacterium]